MLQVLSHEGLANFILSGTLSIHCEHRLLHLVMFNISHLPSPYIITKNMLKNSQVTIIYKIF